MKAFVWSVRALGFRATFGYSIQLAFPTPREHMSTRLLPPRALTPNYQQTMEPRIPWISF